MNNIHLSISLRQANKKIGEQKLKISELTKYNGELVADQVVNEILWKERIAGLEKEKSEALACIEWTKQGHEEYLEGEYEGQLGDAESVLREMKSKNAELEKDISIATKIMIDITNAQTVTDDGHSVGYLVTNKVMKKLDVFISKALKNKKKGF